MKTVIGEILPLALVVTLSPINIIPSILLLFGRRPLLGASAFLAGFLAGVAAVLAGLVALVGVVDLAPSSGHTSWAKAIKLVLGIYLLVAAVRKFRSRPRGDDEGSMPGWMDGIASSSPDRARSASVRCSVPATRRTSSWGSPPPSCSHRQGSPPASS